MHAIHRKAMVDLSHASGGCVLGSHNAFHTSDYVADRSSIVGLRARWQTQDMD